VLLNLGVGVRVVLDFVEGGGHYFEILWQLAIHKKKSAVAPAGTGPFTNTSLLNKFPVIVSLVQ